MKRKGAYALTTEDHRSKKQKRPSVAGPQPSLLAKEEPSFPRGGASILTPLEHKQIKIQAAKDVLFEQSGKKSAPGDDFSEADDQGNNEFQDESKAKPRPKDGISKGRSSKKLRKADSKPLKERSMRIEGLSYKVRRTAQHFYTA